MVLYEKLYNLKIQHRKNYILVINLKVDSINLESTSSY